MITGAVKNKVDRIWTDLWAGGMTNPLTVIEQLTYLMFIRALHEHEIVQESLNVAMGVAEVDPSARIFPQSAAGQSMRWSHFKQYAPQEIFMILSQRVSLRTKKCATVASRILTSTA